MTAPVTGMAAIGNQLINTFMFRILMECNVSCAYGGVGFSTVFSSNDTRIYSIKYG